MVSRRAGRPRDLVGVDGFFDLVRIDCQPAGGESGTDGWTVIVYNNPDYEPEGGAKTLQPPETVQNRTHARDLLKRQEEGVSPQKRPRARRRE